MVLNIMMVNSDIPGYPKTVKTGFRAGFLPTRDRPRPDFLKTGKTRKPTSKPRVPGGFEIALSCLKNGTKFAQNCHDQLDSTIFSKGYFP